MYESDGVLGTLGEHLGITERLALSTVPVSPFPLL